MVGQKRDFDKAAGSWDEEPGRVKLANDVAAAILDDVALTKDMDALDYGCGTGLITLRLQPYVRSITGVDTSRGMLDILVSKLRSGNLSNVRPRFLDSGKGEVLEGRYHVIVSSMTIHHVENPSSLVKQLNSCLLPGGYLCIADLDPEGGAFHGDNLGVFHFGFNRNDMRGLFEQQGLEDVRDRTAATVIKRTSDGSERAFTIFLVSGQKIGP
jgi:2-polyprenyl-3-methyl-5-hydroxy-6-metoxy-1,4-benzoquinol methylase